MNSTANVSHCQPSAHQVSPGTPQTDAPQLQTPAQPAHTTMESSAFHINHVTREESGTIPSVNAFAHKEVSQTVLNVSDVPLVNSMPTEDATAQMDFSSMEPNVSSKPSINVSESPTPTGTELTASASQDSALPETHAIVKESLSETIVKDVPPSPTQSGETESVNATTVMPMLTVFVPSRLLSASPAMSEPSSTANSKNAFHVLTDV